jgi:hypothetical protein
VLVNPWYLGVTFHRYDHGPAPALTLPPIADTGIHRYDLVKQCMQTPPCIDSVSRAIARTFDAGGKLWLVGSLPRIGPTEQPPLPPAAPSSTLGWNIDAYGDAWGKRVLASFEGRLASAEPVTVEAPGPVSEYENIPLFVLTGRPVVPLP